VVFEKSIKKRTIVTMTPAHGDKSLKKSFCCEKNYLKPEALYIFTGPEAQMAAIKVSVAQR
jgi:hypothetical protein